MKEKQLTANDVIHGRLEAFKPIIWTHFSSRYRQKTPEPNNGKSLTVPNAALTLPQLLERYAQGLPLKTNPNPPMFEGDVDPTGLNGVPFEALDLSEQMDLVAANSKKIEDITKRLDLQAAQVRLKNEAAAREMRELQEEMRQRKEKKAADDNKEANK